MSQSKPSTNVHMGLGARTVNLAADNDIFVSDPVTYIRNHACCLHPEIEDGTGEALGSATSATYNTHATAIAKGKLYGQLASARLTAKLYAASSASYNLPMIKLVPGTSGEEFAFLPWREDTCTATTLFSSADIFLTGPLSGCNIYIGEKTGYWPLVLHANSNKNAEDKTANLIAKDTDAINIATKMGYKLTHRLARGAYQIPAFVWGTRAGNDWRFFVHSADVVNRTATNTALGTI